MQVLVQQPFAEPPYPSELEDEPLVVHRRSETADNPGLILFIHGLGGSRYGAGSTWGHFPAFVYEDVPQADVGMYEYRTLFQRGTIELETEAEVLAGIIRDIENYRIIVLMGHSMGGLLAMAAIAHLLTTNQRDALSRICGLFLMATPQTGSQRVPRFLSIFSKDFRVLRPHSRFVTEVNQVFWDHVSLDDSTSSPDKLVIPTWAVIGASDFWVDKLSAGLSLASDRKRTVRASHVEVVKPRTKDADVYQFVKRYLLEVFGLSDAAGKLPFVPFKRPNLVGRDEYVERLHARLKERGAPAVALTGRGGIGKTQLAALYAHDKGSVWPGGVFWVNAARQATPLVEQLGLFSLGMKLAAPGGSGPEYYRQLAEVWCAQVASRSDTLLIVDNVEDRSLLTDDLPGLPGRSRLALGCRVLVTSRLAALPGCVDLEVEILDQEEARRLLLRESGRSVATEQDEATLDDLGRLVGRLPLGLRLVGSILQTSDMSLREFYDGLVQRGVITAIDKDIDSLPVDYQKRVEKSLQEVLRWSWDSLEDVPSDTVRAIARDLFKTLGSLPQTEIVRTQLLRRLVSLPSNEQRSLRDPILLALRALSERNLTEQVSEGVRLHPLIHEYASTFVSDETFREELIVRAATRLRSADYLARADADELLTLLRELPMLESIADERRRSEA